MRTLFNASRRQRRGNDVVWQPQTAVPRVTFEIGELVLEGFAAADRYRIADSLQTELRLLYADPKAVAALSTGGARAQVPAACNLRGGARAYEVGRQAAAALVAATGTAASPPAPTVDRTSTTGGDQHG